jgi:hypothetical protein
MSAAVSINELIDHLDAGIIDFETALTRSARIQRVAAQAHLRTLAERSLALREGLGNELAPPTRLGLVIFAIAGWVTAAALAVVMAFEQ